jgi:membrane protein implicated in regulation of membrane protease activity
MVTVTFLVIGVAGLALLALGVFGGDLIPGGDGDGPLSLPSIGGFVGAFGFAAAATASLVGPGPGAIVVGLVVGVAIAIPAAWGTVLLSRAAARMPTDATPTRDALVGRIGVVVTPVPSGGFGEVLVAIGGQQVKLNARADRAVALGAQVFVVEAPTDTSVVVEPTRVG